MLVMTRVCSPSRSVSTSDELRWIVSIVLVSAGGSSLAAPPSMVCVEWMLNVPVTGNAPTTEIPVPVMVMLGFSCSISSPDPVLSNSPLKL